MPTWVNKARDQENRRCCGDIDCLALQEAVVVSEDGALAEVRVNGKQGFVYKEHLVKVCPETDRQPYACLNRYTVLNDTRHNCMSLGDDGRPEELIFTHQDCFRCLLVIECADTRS